MKVCLIVFLLSLDAQSRGAGHDYAELRFL